MCAKKGPSIVWKYFMKIKVASGYEAQCKLCNVRVKSSGNTTNLKNHLHRKHKHLKASDDGEPSSKITKSTPSMARLATEGSQSEQTDEDDPEPELTSENEVHDFYEQNGLNMIMNGDGGGLSSASLVSISTLSRSNSSVSIECSTTNYNTPKSSRMKQPQINDAISEIKSFEDGGQKAGCIINAILFMIAKDNLPLNTTEHKGFQYLMKIVAPLYSLPGRKTITRLIEQKYELLSSLEKDKLLNADYITLTCDVWTDTLNTVSYLGVTSHFLNDEKLHSVTIGVTELSDKHTADYLGMWLSDICKEWKISEDKVFTVVTDGGANIVKAVCVLFDKSKHLHCFAHMLNLVATQSLAINDIETICNKIKSIITFFKHSVSAYDDLRKLTSLKLIQSVITRWNSTYIMLERFVTLYEHVVSVLLRYPKSPSILSAAEIEIIKDIVVIMRPFFTVTKEISGDSFVTASKVIPLVNCLKRKVEIIETHSETSRSLKDRVLQQISKRFGSIENVKILSVATLLDPRFKKIHFTNPVSCSDAVQKVLHFIRETEENASVTTRKQHEMPNVISEQDSVWDYHKELVNKANTSYENITGEMPTELKYFLNQPLVDINKDPLEYWALNKISLPKVYSVAKQYLAVVPTSTPSERLFSLAGNILVDHRSKLTPKHLNQLLFLNSLNLEDWCL